MVRAGRLVSILLLLQIRGRVTAAELAERLEVSVRTIYRDLEALGAAGVPVCAEPGPRGGCWLVDGYRTRLTGLTAEEAEALVLAGVPGPVGELGLGTALAAAQLKLLAALPDQLREQASRAGRRFHLDVPGWFSAREGLPHLAAVVSAVWDDRALRLRYRREAGQPVLRVVEPLGLVLKAGLWYVVARLQGRGEPHVYRVSRVMEATPLEERFERPPGFDLADFWSRWAREFEVSRPSTTVTVRLAPEALAHLRVTPAGPPDEEGWVRAELSVERLEWAESQLLALGAGVEVLSPAELRERIARTAGEIAARYADSRLL
jgi:predicted DNA-binding transcriptional regulator YafY